MPKPKIDTAPKEEKESRFVIEDIPTQTTPVILDKETNERYDPFGAMMKLLEGMEELKEMAKD